MRKFLWLLGFLISFGVFFCQPRLAIAIECDPNLCNCGAKSLKVPSCELTDCDLGPGTSGGASGRWCAPKLAPKGIAHPGFWLPGLSPGFGPTGALGEGFGIKFWTQKVVPFLLWGAVFLVLLLSLIFLLIGGITWSVSGGNKEGMAKARATVTYALAGLVLGLASFLILAVVGNFFGVNLTGAQ